MLFPINLLLLFVLILSSERFYKDDVGRKICSGFYENFVVLGVKLRAELFYSLLLLANEGFYDLI